MQVDVIIIIFALSASLLIICGAYAWQVNRRSITNQSLLVLCLLLAVSNVGQICQYASHTVANCLLWYHISWIGWSFYPAVGVHFALAISENQRVLRRWWTYLILYSPAVIIFTRSLVALLGISGFQMNDLGHYIPRYVYGPWDVGYTVCYQYLFDILTLGIVGVWGARSGSIRKRKQAQAILISAFLALAIDAINYFAGGGGEFRYVWAIEYMIFSAGLVYTVTHLRFTDPSPSAIANYIVERVREMVVLTTTTGTILQVNAASLSLLGATTGELIGKPLATLVIDGLDDIVWPLARQGGNVAEREVIMRGKDGEGIPMTLSASSIPDYFGDTIGMVFVGEDLRRTKQLQQEVLERTRAEEQLKNADRAKDEFLAILSHELLTPLSVIFLWLDVARNDPGYVSKALEIIGQNAKHQHRMVDDLLNVSRLIHGKFMLKPAEFDLRHLVRECIEEYQHLAHEREIQLCCSEAATPLLLWADGERLRQVIRNLMNNALRYTPAAGTVTIQTAEHGGRAVLSIIDTGCGIPADEIGTIFTPFLQGAKSTGGSLGLGLTIAKGIVELHGGTIHVQSTGEGQGSTFTIELPPAN